MLNIYMLRHGETEWNADGNRYCGRTDLPLTEKGIRQAEAVRDQLRHIEFNAVYSSPLQRARRTAQIAGGNGVITDDRLIEADFGEWEGKSKEQFIPENEELWKSWCTNPGSTRAGGTGETALQILERVNGFYESLLYQFDKGNILVVAHNGVNRFYLAYKLGMNIRDYRKLFIENSTITQFELDSRGELTLVRLNSKI